MRILNGNRSKELVQRADNSAEMDIFGPNTMIPDVQLRAGDSSIIQIPDTDPGSVRYLATKVKHNESPFDAACRALSCILGNATQVDLSKLCVLGFNDPSREIQDSRSYPGK